MAIAFSREIDIFHALSDVSPLCFLLALLLTIVPWYANILRIIFWTRLFEKKMTFVEALKTIAYSEFGAALSPTAVGGSPVKVAMLVRHGFTPGSAITLATIGSLEDFVFFMIALPAAFLLTTHHEFAFLNGITTRIGLVTKYAMIILPVLLLLVFFIYMILRHHNVGTAHGFSGKTIARLRNIIGELTSAYGTIIQKGKFTFLITTLLTGIQWICRYSIITAIVKGLGLNVDAVLFFLLQWLLFSIAMFIPTPGATGGIEASFFFIYGAYVPEDAIGLITSGWRLFSFYIYLSIGLILLLAAGIQSRRIDKLTRGSQTVTGDTKGLELSRY